MPGRGQLTQKKRQRELQLKEKQAEKLARRLERKQKPLAPEEQPPELVDAPDSDQS